MTKIIILILFLLLKKCHCLTTTIEYHLSVKCRIFKCALAQKATVDQIKKKKCSKYNTQIIRVTDIFSAISDELGVQVTKCAYCLGSRPNRFSKRHNF